MADYRMPEPKNRPKLKGDNLLQQHERLILCDYIAGCQGRGSYAVASRLLPAQTQRAFRVVRAYWARTASLSRSGPTAIAAPFRAPDEMSEASPPLVNESQQLCRQISRAAWRSTAVEPARQDRAKLPERIPWDACRRRPRFSLGHEPLDLRHSNRILTYS